eukprot:1837153-Rhodomonas_salina.3
MSRSCCVGSDVAKGFLSTCRRPAFSCPRRPAVMRQVWVSIIPNAMIQSVLSFELRLLLNRAE